MDFDEYDYLDKMVENVEPHELRDTTNGDRVRTRSSKYKGDDNEKDSSRRSKHSKSGDRDRERGSPHRRLSPRDSERCERDTQRKNRESRDRKKDRENNRDRDSYRDRRVRDQEREKDRSSESKSRSRPERRHRDKKEVVEPEVDPERDQRTVFAYQISLKADEKDVYEFFSTVGKVRDVRLIMDRNSRRSRGVGYIEFYESMSVPMAIALSGQLLLGLPVMVKPSEAEKNLVQSTASLTGSLGPYSGGARRLYVGNLHIGIKEDQLRQVFEAFGAVELVQLPTESDTGHSRGYGFVQFSRLEDARSAQSLNGQLEIAGRAIKVSAMTDHAGMQDIGVNPGDFEDDEGGGLALNAQSRALLMQKLDRSGNTSSFPASTLVGMMGTNLPVPSITIPSVDIVGVPSECLLLKNMFDPEAEIEPDFDLDIKEDVQVECSKHGKLKHIHVEKNTAGFVYLRFEDTQASMDAQRALHGRWFAGKMISATFMLPQNYEAKFPDSN